MAYDIIAIGAHPDDVEVGAGGVLLQLAETGKRAGIIYLTAGEIGTGGTVEEREAEAQEAARLMRADILKTYNWGDTSLFDSYDKRLALAMEIRRYKPAIVFCPAPWTGHGRRQSHADHVACGQIAISAVNVAGLKKAPISGEPHSVSRMFYYFLPPGMMPDFVVDITGQYERWIEVLRCHRSQFVNPDKSRDYIGMLESMSRSFGMMAGVKYGQGFKGDQTLLVQDVFDLAKGERF